MASPRIYRITFMSQGRIYELYAKSVGSADLFGFVEVSHLLWSQKSSVVIDPSEDSLRHEFAGVKRFFVPMHSVIRIDEVDHEGKHAVEGVAEQDHRDGSAQRADRADEEADLDHRYSPSRLSGVFSTGSARSISLVKIRSSRL